MPRDQTAAHSDNPCRNCRTRAVSAKPHGHYARVSPLRRTNPSPPTRVSHHRARVRPHDASRSIAKRFYKLHVVAEGVGS
jgi:hypothetical protein